MTTQDPDTGKPCSLLESPREIRDIIYGHILLDFPRPSIECLLRRAVSEVDAILPAPARGGVGAIGNDDGEPENNLAPAFHEEARDLLTRPHRIDTKWFLTNRQIFAEAKEFMLRRGRLVKVSIFGIDISRRLCATELCLIDSTYGGLCVMNHELRYGSSKHPLLEFVVCARDVGNFCRAIMGDTALIIRPKLDPVANHKLQFTTNFHEASVVPEYLARAEVHEQVLQPFRKYLRGFHRVSVQGSCVGLGRQLATSAVEDMRSRLIPDPEEIITDLDDLYSLSIKWIDTGIYYFSILPVYKAWGLCKCIVRDSEMWAGVKRKASDRQVFVEKFLSRAYAFLLLQLVCWNRFAAQLSPHGVYRSYIMTTYEMCLAAARWFGAPRLSLSTRPDIRFHDYTAKALLAHSEGLLDSQPLAIGYKAAQRAFQLAPGRKDVKDCMWEYDNNVDHAMRNGYFLEFDDDVLEQNGLAWWSGSRPWSYSVAGIQDGLHQL